VTATRPVAPQTKTYPRKRKMTKQNAERNLRMRQDRTRPEKRAVGAGDGKFVIVTDTENPYIEYQSPSRRPVGPCFDRPSASRQPIRPRLNILPVCPRRACLPALRGTVRLPSQTHRNRDQDAMPICRRATPPSRRVRRLVAGTHVMQTDRHLASVTDISAQRPRHLAQSRRIWLELADLALAQTPPGQARVLHRSGTFPPAARPSQNRAICAIRPRARVNSK
jgi:hypothetical protein